MSFPLANDNYRNEPITHDSWHINNFSYSSESRHLNDFSYATDLCHFHSPQSEANKVPDRNKNLSTYDGTIHLNPYQSFTICHSQDIRNYEDSLEFSSDCGYTVFEGENWREQNHNYNIRQNTTDSYRAYHISHNDEHSFSRNESCFDSDFQIKKNKIPFLANQTNASPYNGIECGSAKLTYLENEDYNSLNYSSKYISNTNPNYRTDFGSINPDTENNSEVQITQDHAIETSLQCSSQKPTVHQGSRSFTFMGGNVYQMFIYKKFRNYPGPCKS